MLRTYLELCTEASTARGSLPAKRNLSMRNVSAIVRCIFRGGMVAKDKHGIQTQSSDPYSVVVHHHQLRNSPVDTKGDKSN